MRVCIVHCSILQEYESWTMINKCKTRILMCSIALNRKIKESIKLFLKKHYCGLLMAKGQPNTSCVLKTFRYYLQNCAALIGYLNISWTTNIFHQVALLATVCFCLISTPGYSIPVSFLQNSLLKRFPSSFFRHHNERT